jgi:hypothetical protein
LSVVLGCRLLQFKKAAMIAGASWWGENNQCVVREKKEDHEAGRNGCVATRGLSNQEEIT